MKANEAPENIYIQPNAHDGWFECNPQSDIFIEYTRTDVFIEKACEWLKENKDKYLYNTGEKGEYIPTCSSKMIEEFRKHMEGE